MTFWCGSCQVPLEPLATNIMDTPLLHLKVHGLVELAVHVKRREAVVVCVGRVETVRVQGNLEGLTAVADYRFGSTRPSHTREFSGSSPLSHGLGPCIGGQE